MLKPGQTNATLFPSLQGNSRLNQGGEKAGIMLWKDIPSDAWSKPQLAEKGRECLVQEKPRRLV